MQRGDVYELRPPRRAGHEHQGRRCGVVVQAGVVDVYRLGEHVGLVSTEEMWGIDEGLTTVLGLR